ncbi:MAG: Asp-tRNA(Asn)/Glu-tRNA(Gln) amidotransferase subunit GatA [Vulcanimicrobiota bacterium]
MKTLAAQATAVASGQTSARDLLESYLDGFVENEERLHCFLSYDLEAARAQAAAIDQRVAQGEKVGPLAGIPIALKDNICVAGRTTTCGSRMLEQFVPPYDATVWERLRGAGAVLVGKTNLDEFAMGSSTENSAFGPTRNPWDTTRVPGGSSGGSAAAVAAGLVPVSLGSDTGGSIRQPASFCGVTGFKPTYGRVSRFGLVAFASSLDQIGPLARSAEDCRYLYAVIAGHDPRDSTSAPQAVEVACDGDLTGLRIGVPEATLAGLSAANREAFEQGRAQFAKLGVTLHPIDLPHLDYSLAAYYVIAPAEASSNLARYDGVRYGFRASGAEDVLEMFKKSRAQGFGAEVKRRIMLGTYTLSSGYYDAYYLKAQKTRTVLRSDFERAFESVDLVLMPTTPTTAFSLGEKSSDPLEMYLSDIYTVVANLVGLPSLVVPGPLVDGLPYGLQLLGPAWSEERLLNAGIAFQANTDYHTALPSSLVLATDE